MDNVKAAQMIESSGRSASICPISLFSEWFALASAHPQISLPDAFCLSTVSPEGLPEGRMLLLKGASVTNGFRFFTNKNSKKGRALEATPHAAMTMHWEPLHRQVRIQGPVVGIGNAEIDQYFNSRPLMSRIGAWASEQSQVIESRDQLNAQVAAIQAKFGDDIPRPPHWIGFELRPTSIEFWLEQPNRLHDRFLFKRNDAQSPWTFERLQP
jgi:pyridoxamine 5'-phosphate oxidase